MNRKRIGIAVGMMTALALFLSVSVGSSGQAFADRGGEGGRGAGPIIFVESQGLYFDSIVTADPIPPQGSFQDLMIIDGRLHTEFGPGDAGYVGGRWRLVDEDGIVIKYFSCPLLGPGRESE